MGLLTNPTLVLSDRGGNVRCTTIYLFSYLKQLFQGIGIHFELFGSY
jgi:hypothetical protein